ncbi:MAG: hypothetical protein ABIR06_10090 [Cyclobacteriaceae bacterium]
MTSTNQKQEILKTLSSLDSIQAEKVLDFMKGLKKSNSSERHYETIKRQAMKEISQALKGRQMHSSF